MTYTAETLAAHITEVNQTDPGHEHPEHAEIIATAAKWTLTTTDIGILHDCRCDGCIWGVAMEYLRFTTGCECYAWVDPINQEFVRANVEHVLKGHSGRIAGCCRGEIEGQGEGS